MSNNTIIVGVYNQLRVYNCKLGTEIAVYKPSFTNQKSSNTRFPRRIIWYQDKTLKRAIQILFAQYYIFQRSRNMSQSGRLRLLCDVAIFSILGSRNDDVNHLSMIHWWQIIPYIGVLWIIAHTNYDIIFRS